MEVDGTGWRWMHLEVGARFSNTHLKCRQMNEFYITIGVGLERGGGGGLQITNLRKNMGIKNTFEILLK